MSTSTKGFHFDTIRGIGPKLKGVLQERFENWEDIVAADPATLLDIRGFTAETVNDLLEVARAQIALSKAREAAAVPPQAQPSPVGQPKEKLYVKTSRKVDKHTTLRDLVPYSPALCDECGMDLIRKNQFQEWDNCSPATQDLIRGLMSEHKRIQHGLHSKTIITESERKQLGLAPGDDKDDEADFGGAAAS